MHPSLLSSGILKAFAREQAERNAAGDEEATSPVRALRLVHRSPVPRVG